MPIYDRVCDRCEAQWIDRFEPLETPDPPCGCGGLARRVLLTRRPAIMIPDTIDWHLENLGPTWQHFTSRQAWRRAVKAAGKEPFVRHRGQPGSDKSPYTTTWASISGYSLLAAAALLRRIHGPTAREAAAEAALAAHAPDCRLLVAVPRARRPRAVLEERAA